MEGSVLRRCSQQQQRQREIRPGRMTRCECAEVSFADIVESARAEGVAPEEAARRARCGVTCTACVPDLERYLEAL